MTKVELEILESGFCTYPYVNVSELPENYEGTLVFGYDLDRNTVHVYIKAGELYSITYNNKNEVLIQKSGKDLHALDCRPSKRAYRQNTQYFFAELLMRKGYALNFIEGDENEESLPLGSFLKRAKKATI